MKIFSAFLICLAFILNSFGSPLVFKIQKTLSSAELIELSVFDTAKYKSIRIMVTNPTYKSGVIEKTQLKNMIESQRNQVKVYENLINKSTQPSQAESYRRTLGDVTTYLEKLQKQYETAPELEGRFSLFAMDGAEELELQDFKDYPFNRSISIIDPPSKLKIKVRGSGVFTLYVWASN